MESSPNNLLHLCILAQQGVKEPGAENHQISPSVTTDRLGSVGSWASTVFQLTSPPPSPACRVHT